MVSGQARSGSHRRPDRDFCRGQRKQLCACSHRTVGDRSRLRWRLRHRDRRAEREHERVSIELDGALMAHTRRQRQYRRHRDYRSDQFTGGCHQIRRRGHRWQLRRPRLHPVDRTDARHANTFSFNTGLTDVLCLAAEFLAAEIPAPAYQVWSAQYPGRRSDRSLRSISIAAACPTGSNGCLAAIQ